MKSIKPIHIILLTLLLIFLLMQVFTVEHTNPPVKGEPEWDSPQTRELALRACYDCHSNETHWTWYSYVAPASWLIASDVQEGREHMNFSEPPFGEADEAAEEVREGEMPINSYIWLHPEAKLSDQEKTQLIEGFKATFGGEEGK